jgi:hypothetical protein
MLLEMSHMENRREAGRIIEFYYSWSLKFVRIIFKNEWRKPIEN